MDYAQLDNLLVGRSFMRKKLGNNTYAERRGYRPNHKITEEIPPNPYETPCPIAIRLHNTDVLTFHAHGIVTLNSGGYRTVTTKDRLNNYLPAGWHVQQDKGIWYVCWRGERVCTFEEGMTVNSDGGCAGGKDIDMQAPKLRKVRRDAKAYATGFIAALVAGDVSVPGPGDCFYCGMQEVSTGRPLGEMFKDSDHIQSHIEEKYYVPSLLWNAMETFRVSPVARDAAIRWAQPGKYPKGTWEYASDIAQEQLTKAVYRYVLRQLGQVT